MSIPKINIKMSIPKINISFNYWFSEPKTGHIKDIWAHHDLTDRSCRYWKIHNNISSGIKHCSISPKKKTSRLAKFSGTVKAKTGQLTVINAADAMQTSACLITKRELCQFRLLGFCFFLIIELGLLMIYSCRSTALSLFEPGGHLPTSVPN